MTLRCDGCRREQRPDEYEIKRPARMTYLGRRVKIARCRRCGHANLWPETVTTKVAVKV